MADIEHGLRLAMGEELITVQVPKDFDDARFHNGVPDLLSQNKRRIGEIGWFRTGTEHP